MRTAIASRFVTATIAVAAALGGLGVAFAMPASVGSVDPAGEDTVAGDESTTTAVASSTTTADPDGATTTTAAEATTTTMPDPATSTTTPDGPDGPDDGDEGGDDGDRTHPDNHGADVSEVARDRSRHGCEHGRAVSEVASGTRNDVPCPTPGGDRAG